MPDLPGHGESAPQDGSLTVSDLLAGVEALVEAEAGAGQVTLLGNSLGGYVAMLYARRHPQRMAQVILVNGAAVLPLRPSAAAGVPRAPRTAGRTGASCAAPAAKLLGGSALQRSAGAQGSTFGEPTFVPVHCTT